MADDPKQSADDLIKRIDDAPRASREDLLRAVLGEDEVKSQTVLNGLLYGTAPPAAEWVDLADAGPYVDETKMPLYSPNGDGSGGDATFGNQATDKWMDDALRRIAGHPPIADDHSSRDSPERSDARERWPGDTELER